MKGYSVCLKCGRAIPSSLFKKHQRKYHKKRVGVLTALKVSLWVMVVSLCFNSKVYIHANISEHRDNKDPDQNRRDGIHDGASKERQDANNN